MHGVRFISAIWFRSIPIPKPNPIPNPNPTLTLSLTLSLTVILTKTESLTPSQPTLSLTPVQRSI